MLEINTTKNKELGLWDITATLTLPPITVSRLKKDRMTFNMNCVMHLVKSFRRL